MDIDDFGFVFCDVWDECLFELGGNVVDDLF